MYARNKSIATQFHSTSFVSMSTSKSVSCDQFVNVYMSVCVLNGMRTTFLASILIVFSDNTIDVDVHMENGWLKTNGCTPFLERRAAHNYLLYLVPCC